MPSPPQKRLAFKTLLVRKNINSRIPPGFSPGFVSELILNRFLPRPEWPGVLKRRMYKNGRRSILTDKTKRAGILP